ncbi:hypothetical protein COY87_05595, partial [Candidatus Roizmanbacteria bacterium CG_4_10_14_0_8_um_filter_33_9]
MTILIGPSQQSIYPIVAVRDGIIFPKTENVLVFGRSKSVLTINEVLKKDKKMVLVMQKTSAVEDPQKEDLETIGVLVTIDKTVLGEKGEINALVKGIEKVKIIEYTQETPYFMAKVEKILDTLVSDEEIQAMVKHISIQVKKAINLGKTVDFVFLMNILNVGTPQDFSFQIAMVLDIKEREKQELLVENDTKKRLAKEVDFINREVKILEIEQNISAKTQRKFERGMKETFLKEKMKTIEEELGGGEDKEIKEYREKIVKAKMSKQVEEKALKELKRLAQMSHFNPEASYIKSYLDWLVELPWILETTNNIDIKNAEKILNEDHYGLKKIKERILEYLAVLELRKQKATLNKDTNKEEKNKTKKAYQPTIICFIGPPGVGKTS